MSKYSIAILIVPAAFAFAGSLEPELPPTETADARADMSTPPLRVVSDLARGRRWELRWSGLAAYDIASGRIARELHLPRATFVSARDVCLPDMILSGSGALIVSSNIEPRLWRVSPERFEVEVYDIDVGEAQKDVGFSGLSWGPNERTLYAGSSIGAAQWRIDLSSGIAAARDGSRSNLLACAR